MSEGLDEYCDGEEAQGFLVPSTCSHLILDHPVHSAPAAQAHLILGVVKKGNSWVGEGEGPWRRCGREQGPPSSKEGRTAMGTEGGSPKTPVDGSLLCPQISVLRAHTDERFSALFS